MRYIAFLRALNVGGKNVVTMEALRGHFSALGFTDVRSYLQSGNVFFDTDRGESERSLLTRHIEGRLRDALGTEVGVYLRTLPEVAALLALDPFRDVELTPEVRLCVHFTEPGLPRDLPLPLVSPKGDVELLAATDAELCYAMRLVGGRPPDPTRFLASASGRRVPGTTRFWGTTARILAAAERG